MTNSVYAAGLRDAAPAEAAQGEVDAALRELVACMDADPVRNPVMETPGFRWHDAWAAARRALAPKAAQDKA